MTLCIRISTDTRSREQNDASSTVQTHAGSPSSRLSASLYS